MLGMRTPNVAIGIERVAPWKHNYGNSGSQESAKHLTYGHSHGEWRGVDHCRRCCEYSRHGGVHRSRLLDPSECQCDTAATRESVLHEWKMQRVSPQWRRLEFHSKYVMCWK